MSERIKVLFIAGCGRSGSTVLHNVLQQVEGFCAVGELRYIWERGFLKNKLCGCGVAFRSCDFWSTIFGHSLGGMEAVDAAGMFQFIDSLHLHHLPATLLPGRRSRWKFAARDGLHTLERLYRAVHEVTGCRVIVDSSKNPAYGYLLAMIDAIDLHVLHFVRDPRAVAHSWSTKKLFEPNATNPEYMARKHPLKGGLQWIARNMSTARFLRPRSSRYLMMRYEDFVQSPRTSLRDVLAFLGEKPGELEFLTDTSVLLARGNHSVFGNLIRFQRGSVPLRSDDRWRRDMTKLNKISVTALTLPFLLTYGYLRGARHSPPATHRGDHAVTPPMRARS